ncbi:MAG: GNAT family N-acetyltransferase [Gammaproteobacteria bacterium]|nr:GNAT family N-acetyltransferase [Gammaproteobacteria bacterium]
MTYRNLQISDYDEVMQLWRNCDGISLRDADSRRSVAGYLSRNPGLSYVAVADAEIVATLMAGHDGRRGYIQHLAVDDGLREQGVASRLLQLCLDALKSEGIVKSHVHVLSSNQMGLAFWRGRGWTHRAEIEMYSFINGNNQNS